MPEVKRPVRTIEVNYLCDKCGHGMMKQVGPMDQNSGDCPHECLICGNAQVFKWVTYPRIDYVGEGETFD